MNTTERRPRKSRPSPKAQFITRRALAERWGRSYMTIRRREWSGALTPIRKPTRNPIRYCMKEVRAVEALG